MHHIAVRSIDDERAASQPEPIPAGLVNDGRPCGVRCQYKKDSAS